MAKRLLKSVLIGLKRDDKDWSPKPGEVHDFTAEEIKAIEEANPDALRLPPDESKDKTMRSTPVEQMSPHRPLTEEDHGQLGGPTDEI